MTWGARLVAEARAAAALVSANVRYWTTVLPHVHRGLRHWEEVARRIPDPSLRRLALDKIAGERFNTEVAATLATLAPRRKRADAIEAIVALQVMYDYLDGLSEEPVTDQLGSSLLLFSAFEISLTPEQAEPVDYYGAHPRGDDGGYLEALVVACQTAIRRLPSIDSVAAVAREASQRCGEAQSRTHAIEALGTEQLAAWAGEQARGTGLTWWEYAAGSTASILSVHALIAIAGHSQASAAEAKRLDSAYLFIAAISTLLDSLIDQARDVAEGSHSFVGYYENEPTMVERISYVVGRGASEGQHLDSGGHHRMTAAGVASYYLSAPATRHEPGRTVKARVRRELRPLILPVLEIFRLWRLAKTFASR